GLAATPYTVRWSTTAANNCGSPSGSSSVADPNFTHVSDLTHGTWYVCVRATDAVGNSSAWSSAGMVLVDIVAPEAPDAPATTSPTTDTTPTWTWNEPSDDGVGL